MAIRTRPYTVIIGVEQQLEIAPSEDVILALTFLQADGVTPIDLTGTTSIVLTIRDWQGLIQFGGGRLGTVTDPTHGVAQFQFAQSETGITSQAYEADVYNVDAGGHHTQLLPGSPLIVLPAVFSPAEPLTSVAGGTPVVLGQVMSLRHTVTSGDAQDFYLTLPALLSLPYAVIPKLHEGPVDAEAFCPIADRSTTRFHVLLSAPCVGAVFEFLLVPCSVI